MKYFSAGIAWLLVMWSGSLANAAIFSNPGAITLPTGPSGTSPGSPYPSPITVSGLSGTITKVTVTLNNINHDRPDDLEILLVGPTGAKFVLLADAGGTATPAAGVNLTLDDAAAAPVPDSGPLSSGSFQPACVDFQNNIQTEFAASAPAGPYNVPAPRGSSTLALTFNGTAPNGTWNLYVVDDIPSTPGGAISGGWTLNITSGTGLEPTVTSVTSSLNPSFSGSSVTFAATVRRTNNAASVSGGVIFKEGTTVLQASNVVNASGQVTFTTSALTEGVHVITAEYTGNASFFGSSTSVVQSVDTATTISGNTFLNRGVITVADTANVYPSHLYVTNLLGTISKVTMSVSNISYARPDDLELLLVAPNGAHFVVLADAGGTATAINNVTLSFDDAAANLISDTSAPATGTYRPTDYNTTAASFPPPAPAGPYNHPAPAGGSTFANIFNGANPNGTWSLYVVDDVPGGGGTIAGGWSLTFTTSGDAPTMTTLASSLNPSLTGQSVTFTAAVKRVSNSTAVTNGTVTFREGATILQAAVALNTNGLATFASAALAQGNHVITADYNGAPGFFNVSSATITQRVDNVTVVSSNLFCNTGAITIPQDSTAPLAYPSRILVSGAGTLLSNISVTISNISIERPDDLEFLLVSPTGARFVLLSDAGGTATAATNVTLTFSDAAANAVPDAGPLASGTFRPTSMNSSPASFPAPAPAAPYNQPPPAGSATLASVFNGANPNGYWSLYVFDDVPGTAGNGTIANGWCLSLLTSPAITCPADIMTTNALGQCQSAPISFAATTTGFPTPALSYRIGASAITSPRAFPLGITTVTATASNASGAIVCSFNVTVIAASLPRLNIARSITNAVLSWPNGFNCFTLQSATRLVSPPSSNVWTVYPGPFVTNAGNIFVTNSAAVSNRFFRLVF